MFSRRSLFGSWGKRESKRQGKQAASRRRSWFGRRHTMAMEPLEDRRLLAVTFGVVGTTVNFSGDGADDDLRLRLNAVGNIEFSANAGPFTDTGVAAAAAWRQVNVALGFGEDDLFIDHGGAGGFFGAAFLTVNYEGGPGSNRLFYQNATVTSDLHILDGAENTGRNFMTGGVRQLFTTYADQFLVGSEVDGPIEVRADDGDNAITVDGFGALVDNRAIIGFVGSSRTDFTVDGRGGSDTFNVAIGTFPDFTTLTIDGGDPTASDTLVVNGIFGQLDNLRYLPTGVGAGTVVNDSAAQPDTAFTGIEHLTLVVQQADGDGVRQDGTLGNDAIEFFHGLTSDKGSFVGTMDQNNATGVGPFTMTPMSYSGISPLVNDTDVNFFGAGGTDTFVFNGTANDDNIVISTGEAGGTEFQNTLNGILVASVEVFNVASGLVRGLAGNDTITVSVPAGPAAVALRIEGGDSDGSSDVINYTAAPGGGAVTVNAGTQLITQAGSNPVSFSGVERVNLNASANDVTLVGTAGVDNVEITPTGTNALTAVLNGVNPLLNFSNVGATFALTGGGNANDGLIFNGTPNDDIFNLTRSGPGTDPQLELAGTQAVLLDDNAFRSAVIRGLGEVDTFNLTDPGAVISNIDFVIEGGNSVGDVLNYTTQFSQTYRPGSTRDSGAFDATVPADTIFSGIATANFTYAAGASAFTVEAGSGANQITANGTGAAAVRVTVDNNTTLNLNNLSTLNLNAGAGDDVIAVTPGAFAGTGINVSGGDPTASDTVIVTGTTGVDTVTIAGLTLDGATVTGLGAPIVVTTAEKLIYNGLGGNDSLTVTTPAGGDEIDFIPQGDVFEDAASINISNFAVGPVQRRLPLEYLNLGAGATVTLADAGGVRADLANIRGTEADTRFDVTATGQVHVLSGANALGFVTVPIQTPGVQTLRLRGLEGDDVFNIPGNPPVHWRDLRRGGQSLGQRRAELHRLGAGAVTVDFGAATVQEAGFAPVGFSGVEILNVVANNALNIVGTASDDSHDGHRRQRDERSGH